MLIASREAIAASPLPSRMHRAASQLILSCGSARDADVVVRPVHQIAIAPWRRSSRASPAERARRCSGRSGSPPDDMASGRIFAGRYRTSPLCLGRFGFLPVLCARWVPGLPRSALEKPAAHARRRSAARAFQLCRLFVRAACAWRRLQPAMRAVGGLLLARLVLKEKLPAQRAAGALIIIVGLGVIGGEALATMGTHGLIGDLAFVTAGLMFATFGMLLRLWQIAPMRAVAVTSVLALADLPIYCAAFGFQTHDRAGGLGKPAAGDRTGHFCRRRRDLSVHPSRLPFWAPGGSCFPVVRAGLHTPPRFPRDRGSTEHAQLSAFQSC